MACSSKNGNTLVLGLIPWAVNVIVLLLIKGTNATEITLLPKLCLTVCGTIVVLIPLLVWTTSLLVVCTKLLPCHLSVLLGLPVHWSCHSFHSVPTGISEILVLSKPLLIAKLSNVPLTLATISGATLVSFHSSTGGSNSISPIQLNIKKGFKFSVLKQMVVQ